ncbi:MAG: tetratricopeptide repeat protein [Bacteroidaceae bacterium]|nr:tetratricopeptide repeat protein [Bacteroidaceae bacterium]
MRTYIQQTFKLLTKEQQKLMSVLSVISTEGISVGVACNIMMSECPRRFVSCINQFCASRWLFCDQQNIYCHQQIAASIQEIAPIEFETNIEILSILQKHISLHPFEDMFMEKEYFFVSRLFLTYLMRNWHIYSMRKNSRYTEFINLFAEDVIAFSNHAELGFGDKRQRVSRLEDRADFMLLDFLAYIDGHSYVGSANIGIGKLFNNIFRYEEAKECFRKAEAILGQTSELLLAKAMMYQNLGVLGSSFLLAYRAYLLNNKNGDDEKNIRVCLYLAFLCAYSDSTKSSKLWLKKMRSLMHGCTIPPNHEFNIVQKETEALTRINDKALAFQILDRAELEIIRLYGLNAPEMATVSYIRSYIYGNSGQLRNSAEEYRNYVHYNHFNYGYSIGDTIVLYSAMINDNVTRGNNVTANIFTATMENLCIDNFYIAPGVRISRIFASCSIYYINRNFELCEKKVNEARKILKEELMINDITPKEIKSIFYKGIIPKSVLMDSEIRLINLLDINLYIAKGQNSQAKNMLQLLIQSETDNRELLHLQIHVARIQIIEGERTEGVKLWWEILEKADKRDKFGICKEIAEWAFLYDMAYEAKEFLEVALYFDVMVYAKTNEIAETLQFYARVLGYYNIKGSEEPWEQSAMLLQSLNDKDGLALLYLSWGAVQQDCEAERLIKKAIALWQQEHDAFDETLSTMYHHLACTQAMLGKSQEASHSAKEAIRLYPTDYPSYLYEEIENYL